jgi:hypothetical protein
MDSAKLIYSIIPATFHMLCMYMNEVNHGRFLISLTLLSCEDKEWEGL